MQTFIFQDEEWKPIDECDNYEVSNYGRVRNKSTGTILKLYENKARKSYMYVSISDNKNKHRHFSVHRLVAKAFIPNPENKPHVNHIDYNTMNNAVTNLEWVTAKENVHWTINGGRRKIANERAVVATNIKTGEKLSFKSLMEAKRAGYDRPTIRRNIQGKTRQYRGFVWEYLVN